MEKRIASAAIFVCAVMALVAAAPLVAGDIHEVTKGAKGPNASAVSWDYVAPDYGQWNANITNNGLRWMVIKVFDNSTGVPVQIAREHIRFAAVNAYPTGIALSSPVQMAKNRAYVIEAVPNGPKGSSALVMDEFAVKVPPVAEFTATMNWMTVSVDASASYDPDGGTITYAWNFGDGSTGTGVTATHTYLTAGMKTITLTVTDNDGFTDTATATVEAIEPPPVLEAIFTATMDFMTVTVDASLSTGEGPLSYAWEFGDAATATGVTATHTYLVAGPYTITLTVTDVNMATATATRQVTAIEPPPELPPVAVISADIVYLDVSVDGSGSYDPDGGTIVSWAWNFGDGSTASGPTATHSYLTAGVKTITLTVTDSDQGLTGTATTQVTAVEPPKPPIASFTANIVYLDVSVDGSGSSDPDGIIVAWDWDFGDGATATGVTATHSYLTAGVKTITLMVTDSQGLQDSATKDVTAVEPPKPPVASFDFTTHYLSASFTSTSTDPDSVIVTWAWDFGDGGTATGETATHAYAAGGTYPVTLTVTDSQTLSDSVTQSVTVAPNPPPVASFTWSVSGTTVSVDASGSTDDMPIASYAWDFGDGGTATGVTASHTYVKPVLSAHVILITPAGVILQEPPPYTCVGYTYGPDGVTAMPNSAVTVTNGRTGATLTTTSDPDFGIYQVNMNKFVGGVLAGDPISVTATNGALSGTNTGVADPSQGYLMIDVVMMGSGPVIVDYTITLTVTDSEGLTDSMSAIVTITFPA